MTRSPKISFRFPYRWLVGQEEREFLSQNLVNMAQKSGMIQVMHPDLPQNNPAAYSVILKYIHYQPVKIPLKAKDIQETFEPLFAGARLIGFNTEFVQRRRTEADSGTMEPVMEMEIYY